MTDVLATLPNGAEVLGWTLRNDSGASVSIMSLGAVILSLKVPDRDGRLADVVQGFDRPEDYLQPGPYFGCVVGRYANRIAKGRFRLDGRDYQLAVNNGLNALHGGLVGFDKRLWNGGEVSTSEGPGVRLSLISEDGDEAYPGQVRVEVTYVWTANNRLIIDYVAEADAPTVINLTQHSYFNLSGAESGSVLDHALQISAERFAVVDETQIPTGELRDVAGTPFDFRTPKPIGAEIGADDPQLRIGSGYDQSWALDGAGLRTAGSLFDPASGRRLIVETDQPALQVYTANHLDTVGKGGARYGRRSSIALETQHFPDSPNQPAFPDTTLRPGSPFRSRTVFAFGVG